MANEEAKQGKRKRASRKVMVPHEALAAIKADLMRVGSVLWANGDTDAAGQCKAAADMLPVVLAGK